MFTYYNDYYCILPTLPKQYYRLFSRFTVTVIVIYYYTHWIVKIHNTYDHFWRTNIFFFFFSVLAPYSNRPDLDNRRKKKKPLGLATKNACNRSSTHYIIIYDSEVAIHPYAAEYFTKRTMDYRVIDFTYIYLQKNVIHIISRC